MEKRCCISNLRRLCHTFGFSLRDALAPGARFPAPARIPTCTDFLCVPEFPDSAFKKSVNNSVFFQKFVSRNLKNTKTSTNYLLSVQFSSQYLLKKNSYFTGTCTISSLEHEWICRKRKTCTKTTANPDFEHTCQSDWRIVLITMEII